MSELPLSPTLKRILLEALILTMFAIAVGLTLNYQLVMNAFSGKTVTQPVSAPKPEHQPAAELAVVQDFPEKSSLQGELFCSAELRIQYSLTSNGEKEAYLYNVFMKFHPAYGPELLQDTLTALVHPYLDWYEGREYSLHPFKDSYFDFSIRDGLSHANIKLLSLLGWLSLIILILYCTGFGCPDSFDLGVILLQQGYQEVRVYEGGYPEWRDQGRPIVEGGQ